MIRNGLKTTILLASLGGLLVLVGRLVFGGAGAVIGLLLGLAIVGGSYWFSDRLAIRAAHAMPVTEAQMPEYYAIVRTLAAEARLPMPKLYVTPDEQPNVFATGRNPNHAAVAVTRGILDLLTWDELKGVLAHELSHVGNRDILLTSVAAAIATGISFVANMALWFGGGDEDDANPFVLLLLAILAPIAGALLQMALSRSREFEADRRGAELVGTGEPLARALLKLDAAATQVPMRVTPEQAPKYIVNPLTGRKVRFASLFTTHPPTEERVDRLLSASDRPRPRTSA